MKESCEYWINQNKQLEYQFEQYITSTENDRADIIARLMSANTRNDKLKQKAIAGWITAAILGCVVIGVML